ncbi:hypothetical protein [Natranaerobius thermophilus]|uniref:hypothetical protein n=1 Tax=Natranaerobius thermophilus TaxID=375929 RepID=UPI0001666C32|nr:hypothetical protein [Natranaerobius thermophilus]
MGTNAKGASNEEHKTSPHYEVTSPERQDDLLSDYCIQRVLELDRRYFRGA